MSFWTLTCACARVLIAPWRGRNTESSVIVWALAPSSPHRPVKRSQPTQPDRAVLRADRVLIIPGRGHNRNTGRQSAT